MRHPVAGRLWRAAALSTLGDFVGLGALLLLAFERSGGRVIGPAALFAIQALPALAAGSLAGSWLDQVPRGRALAVLQLVGAAALVLPLTIGGVAPVFGAAAALGAVRAASVSVRSGAMAEGVPDAARGTLLALFGTTEQTAQVIGFASGASLTLLTGATWALLFDALTFVVAAAVIARIDFPRPQVRPARPPVTAGLSSIWRHPVLRLLAPLVWVTALVGALPEALAAGVTDDAVAWTPFVLAAGPAGQAVTMAVLGRRRDIERPSFQMTHLAWFALAFGVAALGRSPVWFLVGNLLVGSGVAWLLGPQTLFVRVAPPERMAQVTGTMIAAIIAFEGAGTLIFGAIADATDPRTAYRVAGFTVLVTALVGWVIKERTPEALDLDA